MRPKVDKLVAGVTNILIGEILSQLPSARSHANIFATSVVLNTIASMWENSSQFPLIQENKDLRDVLEAAGTTLKATERDHKDEILAGLIPGIEAELEGEYEFGEQYPSVQLLQEKNVKLKEALDQTIVAVDRISRNHPSQALDELRQKIRVHLRKHLDRSITAAAVTLLPTHDDW